MTTTTTTIKSNTNLLSTHLPTGCAGWKKSSLATCKRAVKRGWLRPRADSGACECCGVRVNEDGEMGKNTRVFTNPYSGVACVTSRCVGAVIDAILVTPGGVRTEADFRLWNSMRMLIVNEDIRAYSDIID